MGTEWVFSWWPVSRKWLFRCAELTAELERAYKELIVIRQERLQALELELAAHRRRAEVLEADATIAAALTSRMGTLVYLDGLEPEAALRRATAGDPVLALAVELRAQAAAQGPDSRAAAALIALAALYDVGKVGAGVERALLATWAVEFE